MKERGKEEHQLGTDEQKPQHHKGLPKPLQPGSICQQVIKIQQLEQPEAGHDFRGKSKCQSKILEHGSTETKPCSSPLPLFPFLEVHPGPTQGVPSLGDDKRNRSIFP